jgi:hypothetical protein
VISKFLEEAETDPTQNMSGGWDDEFEHFLDEEEAEHMKKIKATSP